MKPMRAPPDPERCVAGAVHARHVCRLAPIALVLCGAALAQPVPDTSGKLLQAPGRADIYRGSRIIGAQVRDRDGRRIGDIHDLILGSGRSEVAYAVISFGGVLGVGKTFHAVPWSSLEPQAGGRYYVFSGERGILRGAPGLDLTHWPDIGQQAWRDRVDSYWETVPASTSGGETEGERGR